RTKIRHVMEIDDHRFRGLLFDRVEQQIEFVQHIFVGKTADRLHDFHNKAGRLRVGRKVFPSTHSSSPSKMASGTGLRRFTRTTSLPVLLYRTSSMNVCMSKSPRPDGFS